MRALLFDGQRTHLTSVADPVPGPGSVLLQVTAAGLCHSDLDVMSRPVDLIRFPLPVILGHEACGTVVQVGDQVTGVQVGESVAVHGPRGCGSCRLCRSGAENYCRVARAQGVWPIGLGRDGALAELLLIDDVASLVPLDGVAPVVAAPLTDAGLTPYHAIARSRARFAPGSTALVIGVGGLGHLAIQMLGTMAGVTIVAVDVEETRLSLARSLGAAHAVLGADAPAVIAGITEGAGADVVLDLVGSQATIDLALRCLAQHGDLTLVGLGGGAAPVGLATVPLGTTVRTTFWGSRAELVEVLALARGGQLDVVTTAITLDDVLEGYAALRAGRVEGRLVVVPG